MNHTPFSSLTMKRPPFGIGYWLNPTTSFRVMWVIIGMAISIPSFSQDYSKLETAFAESYEAESDNNYTKAIKILKEKYDAKSYPTNIRLGWLHYKAGLYVESADYYQKAINLMPLSIEARLGYVLPAEALNNWSQAIKKYEEILAIDSKNTTANYRLGHINYYRKNYKQAYSYLEKNVNSYVFDHYSLILFAWTNLRLGKLREAKILFHMVLLVNPEDTSAKEGLALIK
ncbi:MAG: hypothetical protein K2Q22_10505 [Cytophagales bacterium]|nr:hypothetical protein [Cytophagales bacterium]